MQLGPFSTQQDLGDLCRQSAERRHAADQQGGASIARVQPDGDRHQDPEREVADDPQHPAEVVVVDARLAEVEPGVLVAEVGDGDSEGREEGDAGGGAHS